MGLGLGLVARGGAWTRAIIRVGLGLGLRRGA